MRKSALLPLLACVALVALPAELAGGQRRTSDVRLIAGLSGHNEVDDQGNADQGDLDGYGAASITVRRNRRVCWQIAARNIGTVVAGHIHRGASGVNGPVVLDFFEGGVPARLTTSSAKGCERVARTLWRELRRTPEAFYANIHTSDFQNGAIRGQLSR